jgi:hypothetical protein
MSVLGLGISHYQLAESGSSQWSHLGFTVVPRNQSLVLPLSRLAYELARRLGFLMPQWLCLSGVGYSVFAAFASINE